MAGARSRPLEPPAPFTISRSLKAARYPLLTVFPGLDQVPPFAKYPCSRAKRSGLARDSFVEIAPRQGEWMYVAPHELPPNPDPRWRPVVSRDDVVVASRSHLRQSSAMVLYLDILHELFHVVQRSDGRELWDEKYEYADRPTEVEAYLFAVNEARRLSAPETFLQEYLKVEWMSADDHRRLCEHVGVAPPPKRSTPRPKRR